MLVRGGMRTVQTIGIPSEKLAKSLQADAVVIALKSRSIAPEAAVAQSLEALARLQALVLEARRSASKQWALGSSGRDSRRPN